ncbi:MAG: hypothetical protein ABI042_17180 [Verrucomicrobiota bacterium]
MQISRLSANPSRKSLTILLIVLLAVLAVLFHKSFQSGQILFSNDGPLGAIKAEENRLPANFSGNWQDANWIGGKSVSASPNVSAFLSMLFPPEIFLKLYGPFTLLLLGLSVWLCFRELRFNPWVCILGGVAAALNMHAFSIACWGLGPWIISFAMIFFAMAALVTPRISKLWIKGVLAGMAVGIGLMEGYDVGAIDSIYFGIFGLFAGLAAENFSRRAISRTLLVMALVVVFSAFTAAHTISTLVGSQVKNVGIAQQENKTKEERWTWATQWSLPKMETLRVLIPGIFGYRMVTGDSQLYEKSYWGAIAQTPGYETSHQGLSRHSGSGEYAGIFVLLLSIFAIAQSFRKESSPFSAVEKRFVWFWFAIAFVSLLFAFGRHAPFYQILFQLPYFSTIRNPIKFMHPFHIALLMLFGYGLESMVRLYFSNSSQAAKTKKTSFEKKWIIATFVALGVIILGWMKYTASTQQIISYLVKFDFQPGIAAQIAAFSQGEVMWFVLFFAASVILIWAILRGKFAGNLRVAGILATTLIVFDLSHADAPWIVYFNYQEKYARNPVIDALRERPYEQRVIGMLPFPVNDSLSMFQQYVYYTEWLQHHFLYYGIQAIDVAQEPRIAADNAAYRGKFMSAGLPGQLRLWQLTNVKYMFGLAGGFADSLNQQIDPEKKRFKAVMPFAVSQERQAGAFLVETNSTGPFALLKFDGALPRAKLFGNWQTLTNDVAALDKLGDPAFDPFQTVLVSSVIPAPEKTAATNSSEGTVQFANYHPKRVTLTAEVKAPSVLLLNDKFDADWKVFVDGAEKPLLRCNYLMRGVRLDPGNHKVEFRFLPPVNTLYISIAALVIGLCLCAFVAFRRKTDVLPEKI